MRPYGFTLIELLVVLVIMTVFTGLALPRLVEQAQSARQNACFSDFATIIGLARFHAVETGLPQEVVIDLEQNSILFTSKDGAFVKKGLPSGLHVTSVRKGLLNVRYSVVKLPFYPNGTTVPTQIKIEANNKQHMQLEIDGATGNLVAR